MNPSTQRSQSTSRTPGAGGSPVVRGITLGSTRLSPGSSRPGKGRLGRAVRAAKKKKPASRKRAEPTARKALGRWEDEGGRTTPPVPISQSKKRQKRMAKSKRKPTKPASSAAPAQRASPPDDSRQRRAKTAVKKSRIKESGLDSRVLGHVSARGKRNQARRDSKSKL